MTIQIIQRENLEMKKMHFLVAKRKTRSDKSWKLNEKFIKEKRDL